MNIIDIIEKKRDKKELSKEEIYYFVNEYTKDNITDYQAAALIMAIYLNGMNNDETVNLTMAMAESGEMMDLSDISNNIVDKHSTGGVGDKITIILMPIVASLGVPIAKMSGRGLGFTGGTADKLAAIPGYHVDITMEEFKNNVKEIGISLITTNSNLAPADKKIYALRDTIACVSNIPLIASSIMSKKIASGANKILIDLTCGSGAFMKNVQDAEKLARTMIDIGKGVNREVRCVLTSMDEPVGYTIGNQLEIIESIEALKGNMKEDVKEIVYELGAETLVMSGNVESIEAGKLLVKQAIESGKALSKFKEMVKKQGGDTSYIDDISKFKNAKYIVPVYSNKDGYITNMDTEKIGKASVLLGAGRMEKDDIIDMQAGFIINKKLEDKVKYGDILAYIHTNRENIIDIVKDMILDAYCIECTVTKKMNTVIEKIY